ncbi:MAG TPA: TRAP transporter substrate-binding protein [Syntrophorhabdaceae bacterium]|jgi:TRAP-type C4-dicarboxylate transport system substrate-binding protein
MIRKVWPLFIIVSLLVSFTSLSHADAVKLKFANYFPPTHMNSKMLGKYCDELNKKLAGKVEITQYTGGTLLTAPKMAAGVASGIADIGFSNCSYSRGRFPAMEIMELPLGFPSSWIATHVANDFYAKFKPKEWDTYHPLMFSTSPPNVIQTLSKPVRTLEDLRQMKIRGQGRLGDIVKSLGAVPMPIEIVDLYEALRRGVIDGTYTPLETLKGFKLGEVEKYVTASWKVGSVFAFYVVMNKNKWNSLPPDVQKVITDHTKEFVERWAVEWNNIDIEGADFFKKQGGQILPISETEAAKWVKASEPVIVDFKKDLTSKGYKGPDIDTWLAFIRERIEYWKGQEKARKVATAYQY